MRLPRAFARRAPRRWSSACPRPVPEEIAESAHFKLDQPAPVATTDELAEYDAIIVGVPTRYGRMASQMAAFWDGAGALWASGALTGKVGSVFSSTATQHGGQETTLFSGITNLLHFGMVIVGLPYALPGQMTLDEIVGGAPYGATTIAGGQGQRQPSADRARRRPLPGPARRPDRREAEGLSARSRRPATAPRRRAAQRSLIASPSPVSGIGATAIVAAPWRRGGAAPEELRRRLREVAAPAQVQRPHAASRRPRRPPGPNSRAASPARSPSRSSAHPRARRVVRGEHAGRERRAPGRRPPAPARSPPRSPRAARRRGAAAGRRRRGRRRWSIRRRPGAGPAVEHGVDAPVEVGEHVGRPRSG